MKISKLGEVCDIYQSKTISKKDMIDYGEYSVFGANGIIGKYDKYNHENSEVLLGCRGTCGVVNFSKPKSWINGNAMVVSPRTSNLLKKYVYYFLKSVNYKNGLITGTSQPQITGKNLKNLSIPIPAIECQKEIIINLDNINKAIKNRKKSLKDFEDLLDSKFKEMFGNHIENDGNWAKKQIGDIALVTKLAGFEYSKHINYQESGEVIMVKALNVKNKKIKLDNVSYIDKKTSDLLPRSKLKKDDIVLTYIGINIGESAIVDDENLYHLAPNVAKISIVDSKKHNALFLLELLLKSKPYLLKGVTNTAKAALNMGEIRKIPVIVPPIELQEKFAKYIINIEKQKELLQQDIKDLSLLLENKIREYFT